MLSADRNTFNAVLASFSSSGQWLHAASLTNEMITAFHLPDEVSCDAAFAACKQASQASAALAFLHRVQCVGLSLLHRKQKDNWQTLWETCLKMVVSGSPAVSHLSPHREPNFYRSFLDIDIEFVGKTMISHDKPIGFQVFNRSCSHFFSFPGGAVLHLHRRVSRRFAWRTAWSEVTGSAPKFGPAKPAVGVKMGESSRSDGCGWLWDGCG